MKIVSLKLNKEFKRLYYRGRFKGHALLVTYMMKNSRGMNRVGITTGKKVGGAVARSRSRRVIRAAWQEVSPGLPQGYDFVFVARSATPSAKSGQIARVMKGQIASLMGSAQNQARNKPKKR
ncbi:MAG: ribonuclease P protein component [Oscillospiraceae bacterium]